MRHPSPDTYGEAVVTLPMTPTSYSGTVVLSERSNQSLIQMCLPGTKPSSTASVLVVRCAAGLCGTGSRLPGGEPSWRRKQDSQPSTKQDPLLVVEGPYQRYLGTHDPKSARIIERSSSRRAWKMVGSSNCGSPPWGAVT